jgi:hypothetical protein
MEIAGLKGVAWPWRKGDRHPLRRVSHRARGHFRAPSKLTLGFVSIGSRLFQAMRACALLGLLAASLSNQIALSQEQAFDANGPV